MTLMCSNMRDAKLLELTADVLGDVAWRYMRGRVTFDHEAMAEPISGETRQTFVLRLVGDDWKVIRHHESRLIEEPDGISAQAVD